MNGLHKQVNSSKDWSIRRNDDNKLVNGSNYDRRNRKNSDNPQLSNEKTG